MQEIVYQSVGGVSGAQEALEGCVRMQTSGTSSCNACFMISDMKPVGHFNRKENPLKLEYHEEELRFYPDSHTGLIEYAIE